MPKGKPLPKKKTAAVLLFAVTVFAAVMLFTDFLPDIVEIQKAKTAYKEADYQKVYELLSGKERKTEEEEMYQAALLVEQMQRPMESYLNYQKMGMDLKALDALVKGVGKYQAVQEKAEKYGVQEKTEEIYQTILEALDSAYGVSEDKALEILAAKDDVYYTLALKQALGMETPDITGDGQQTGSDEAEPVEESGEPREDLLDEEADIF